MLKFLVQRPKWIVAVAGILIFWSTQTGWLTGSYFWQKTQGILIDRRYDLRRYEPPNPNIVLIGLDSASFQLDTIAPEEIAALLEQRQALPVRIGRAPRDLQLRVQLKQLKIVLRNLGDQRQAHPAPGLLARQELGARGLIEPT